MTLPLSAWLIFRPFNWVFKRGSKVYGSGVGQIVNLRVFAVLMYLALLLSTYFVFQKVPPGFVPSQDKQYLISFAQLPNGATLDRTEKVIREMSDIALKQPGVESSVAFPGLSINGFINSPSAGIVFVTLKPFEERKVAGPIDLNSAMAGLGEEDARPVRPRDRAGAADEIFRHQGRLCHHPGAAAGQRPRHRRRLQASGGGPHRQRLRGAGRRDEAGHGQGDKVAGVQPGRGRTAFHALPGQRLPQLNVDLDRTKAQQLGVNVQDVFDTLQIYLGSLYINDFNKFGRVYQVVAQADRQYRSSRTTS